MPEMPVAASPHGRSADNDFAGHTLHRLAHRRRDEGWLAVRLEDPATRFVPVVGGDHLVTPGREDGSPEPVLLTPEQAHPLRRHGETVFLAVEGAEREETQGGARFALLLPDGRADLQPVLDGLGSVEGLRALAPVIGGRTAALLATARAFAYWHERHRFCGVCGAATESLEAGHLRRCTASGCGREHFPRTDPAVIVLVTAGRGDDKRALLARHPSWQPGVYSTLAGFVEPGESLEAAVAREVFEETGVELARIVYHSSQPWPFPGSIMIGFDAEAATPAVQEALRPDPEEIEDARWLTRAELAAERAAGRIRLPSQISIARRLVDEWIGRTG